MDEITRSELEKLHGRINEVKERVVMLEAQQPHISAALVRIEAGTTNLEKRINGAVWKLALIVLGPIGLLLVKAFASGALKPFF